MEEPALITVGRFPFPYRAGLALAPDIDSANLSRFRAVHTLIGQDRPIQENSPDWQTLGLSRHSRWFQPELNGVAGLGFDLADSFFFVGDATTFGMYRHEQAADCFLPDRQAGVDCREYLCRLIAEGQIDSFHTFLGFTRRQLKPLLDDFYQWCRHDRVAPPRVWINHSRDVSPTGLCPDCLQRNRYAYLARLAIRNAVGPLWGRKRRSLSAAFVRYDGDTPASPYYLNDILAANGLRFVWLNFGDLHANRIVLPESPAYGRSSILRAVKMDDGIRYWRFDRCHYSPQERRRESYLRDSKEGCDITRLLTGSLLGELHRSEGTSILYSHLCHPRSFPISDETLERLHTLKEWRDAGRIWVTSTARLLEWTRCRTFLRMTPRLEGRRLLVDIEGVDDPIFGFDRLGLEELQGLWFQVHKSNVECAVAVNGTLLSNGQVRRSGDRYWLRGKGEAEVENRSAMAGREVAGAFQAAT